MTREEAIRRIKVWNLDSDDREVLEVIIPELKESEDERIRKHIIDIIRDNAKSKCIPCDAEIAYLERRKEPIPIPDKFSGLKSIMLQYFQSAANRKDDAEIESDTDLWGRKILDYVWKYDENQKEQGPAQFNGESLAEIIKGEFEGFRSLLKKKGIDYEPQSTYWESFARLFDSSAREYLKEKKPVECIEFDNEFKNQVSHLLASVLNRGHDYTEGFVKYVSQSLLEYAKNELKPDEWNKREKLFMKALQTYNARIGQLFEENHRLKEQKSVEWNEEYREEDLRTRFAFYTYKNEEDDGILYLSNVFVEETSRNKGFGTKILAAAEKVAETIGAITIRLKVKQNSPANAWYRKHGYGYLTFEDGYDWLEKKLGIS